MKIAVLSENILNDDKLGYLSHLIKNKKIKIVGAIIYNPSSEWGNKINRIKNKTRKRGLEYALMRFILNKIQKRFHTNVSMDAYLFFSSKKIPVYRTEKKYSENVINIIRSLNPDALLRIGWGFIKEPLLSLTTLGVLSYHHGNLRKYRGQPPGFWQLYNREPELTVTVQILNIGIDMGKIVIERKVPIKYNDSLRTLNRRLYTTTYDLMEKACVLCCRPSFKPIVLEREELGNLYTTPTILQGIIFIFKILFRKIKYFFGFYN
jgi:folate-dependent phosphoribosylglycinamide formyltransferase PurN